MARPMSQDPIFPAEHENNNQPTTYWINNLTRSTVLGVVEERFVRDDWTGEIWSLQNLGSMSESTFKSLGSAVPYLNAALSTSRVLNALQFREGQSLLAQNMISGFISVPLAAEQWKVEARRIFETTLALLQFDILDIAQGTFAEIEGYVQIGKMWSAESCHIVKFNADGPKKCFHVWFDKHFRRQLYFTASRCASSW